jgi:hypothetical protein
MRVITWNMGLATFGKRQPGLHDQAWHYLLGLGPDLALLQETRPPAWVRNEGTIVQGPFRQWGSVIFSPGLPLDRFRLPAESNLRALGSYLALGVASLPDGTDALAVSVHAIDGDATKAQLGPFAPRLVARPSLGRPRVNDAVLAGLGELLNPDKLFIFAGDWNTARKQGTERGDRAGGEFFDRVIQSGWYDCVWEFHGAEIQTWFGGGSKILQDDHAFCDRSLGSSLKRVWVAAAAATELRLSDHAPLILDFDVAPISMTSRAK